MLKKIAFAGVGIALLASPLLASADTASELQARISTLLAQLTQLQAQLANLQSADQSPRPQSPDQSPAPVRPIDRICPQIVRNLEQGIEGNDVKEVQAYLGVTQTGYFGPQTARAVTAFQADEGLTQVGIVGPQTRAAFARRCGWGNNQTFTASPTSGAAPLTVTFAAANLDASGLYTIDFDDESSLTLSSYCAQDEGPCPQGPNYAQKSHTYTRNGTYVAKLMYQQTFYCPSGAMCPAMMPMPKTIGTVTITVDGNTAGGPKLAPQSDTAGTVGAPLSIIGTGFTPGNTNNVFFGNPSVPGGPTLAAANLAPTNVGEKFQGLFFTVPAYIAVGTYPVSVSNANGSSGTNDTNGNPVTYRVRPSATISSISPSPAPVGSTITISGKGFDQQLVNVDILSTTGQEMQVTGATPTYNGTQVSITLAADRVPAGQYLVSVRNVGAGTPFGGVASRAVPLTVTSDSQGRGITVTSPNSGERWDLESQKSITWSDGRESLIARSYDIFLDRTGPICTNPLLGCPAIAYRPFTIARHVAGGSYSWTVGRMIEPTLINEGVGTYTVRVCDSGSESSCDSSDQSFQITNPTYENNRPPVITNFSGPTSLPTGQKGTWLVQASDPEGKRLTYTYSWCDVTNGGYGVCSAQAYPVGGETTNAFTTSFPSAGTYKVSVSVSDDLGKSAQASATVTVSGGTTAATLSAQPTSGAAPLGVTFTSNSPGTINFGDGSSGEMSPNCATGLDGQSRCDTGSYFTGHTYVNPGTYIATLTSAGSCTSGYCAQTASATVTVSGGSTACEVTDIYAESVPGYVYYNLFMKVRNLPGATSKMPVVSITGAESWDNLTFSQVGYSSGVTTLQASQTVNGTGINYIMERKYTIRPVSNGTAPITCTPMGGGGIPYPVPISTYPTQTTNGAGASVGGSSANLANALTALESLLQAFIAKLGQ
ncbi:MAG: peptidoglycan-binding protein [Patescibacteria group bacterium]